MDDRTSYDKDRDINGDVTDSRSDTFWWKCKHGGTGLDLYLLMSKDTETGISIYRWRDAKDEPIFRSRLRAMLFGLNNP